MTTTTDNLTPYEYQFLTDAWEDHDQPGDYLRVGVDCYEYGYIDDFGLVTPKGRKAVERYERRTDS